MSTTEPSATPRVALVTGAASGIGAATARLLARTGPVAVADVSVAAGEQVAADIRAVGLEAVFVELDVTREESWVTAVASVVDTLGGIDVLVNNAGIGDWDPIEQTTLETYMATVAVTQVGTFLGLKHCGPHLRRSGTGAVVNMSSIFAMSGGFGGVSPGYHSAKGAVRTLTKTAALGWAKEGVRVNSIHPGVIQTPLLDGIEDTQGLYDMTPMGRLGTPEDVANAVAFLVSPQAAFITGAELAVDGGFLAQ
ncbi:MAG: short-chain dehydrogenase/reductase [Marmoricola sp.]|nr:short-chain dehydrogenase/reductase [Marmoricola sp.]